MVKNELEQKLDLLLEKGMITPKEYQYLLKNPKKIEEQEGEEEKVETTGAPSLGKNILSFILTIIAIGFVLYGSCVMNIMIVYGMSLKGLTIPLMIVWPLFPVVLFGWIAHKTKNAGMKWAVIILAVGALFVAATMMG